MADGMDHEMWPAVRRAEAAGTADVGAKLQAQVRDWASDVMVLFAAGSRALAPLEPGSDAYQAAEREMGLAELRLQAQDIAEIAGQATADDPAASTRRGAGGREP